MPAARAAASARLRSRLAMAARLACCVRANDGIRRSLILATPRMPKRTLSVLIGVDRKRETGDSGVALLSLYGLAEQKVMCLVVLLYRVSRDAPMIVLANREEDYERGGLPPRRLDGPIPALAGVDPVAGGTWLG